ncbi:efflux RND transporter permease subunit [Desulforhopalus sp. IMCC35007]|uniref:efflux RND transporter permease subunit n=1 Tax=Desulforhopalus sp. IMCC35007 TaxID=2569543 RepID=UPI0010AE983F|nr:efflux RND transporter permease subunit [Desulforhopalus sp. IMCC35007]TKB09667.1 efflux RND transporter permease subunit [Desulforhopalus sp. IMCC35007]
MHSETRGIIPWFVANPVAANLLLMLVIALGAIQLTSLRKEAFPSLEPNSIKVSVTYNSGSAQQAEEGLAIKIEDQLEDVTGIDSITSSSTSSGASITIEKKDDYDLDQLLTDVTTKIDAISTFPVDAKNPIIEKAEREEHSLWLQLYGDVDRNTLQQLADDLKSDLLADDAISRVTISGRKDPMMVVEIEEARLRAYGLSLSDVEDAINDGSSSTASAVMRNDRLNLQLKSSQQAYQKEDFAAIPLLTTSDGHRLLLGEVATISDTFDDETAVLSRYNGHDTISLQVVTTGMDDISESAKSARKVAEQWQNGSKLVEGVELATWYDRSTSINERLQLLIKNAMTGIALVFVLLAVFLNLTVAFWVAMGLPFIFFGTLYFMGTSFIGLTLNEFTTFGFIMALGIVVDDAVVVGESVYTMRAERGDTRENTIKGTLRVALPTIFGVFTTVAAFFALSQISGRMGELYSQFAIVVAICLVLSVIESKLILPAHLAHLNTRPQTSTNLLLRFWQVIQNGADRVLKMFTERCYRPVIEYALHYRYAVTIMFVALFVLVLSMPFTGQLRFSFFPDIPGDTVLASLTMQNDSSYGQTHAALNLLEQRAYQADHELSGEQEKSFITSLQILAEADQSGTITLKLSSDAPYDINTFTRRWQQLAGLPEGTRSLSVQNTRRMVDALRIELRAADDSILTAAGNTLKEQLQAIPAVSGIEDNLKPGQPQLQLKLTEQGRALGMTTEMLAEQTYQGFSGQVVQRYQRNSDEIEVKVRYPEDERQNGSDLLNSSVRTSDGTVLPLASVATVTYGYTRDTITRIDGKRAVYISADVDKDAVSATELVSTLKATLTPTLQANYPGLTIHFAGEAEQQAETQSSMVQVFFIAMLMIYMLLAIPLKSYIQPLIIMTAIPFGIVGALLGHWLNDLSLGILSLNGIIALSGVVVNDSLLLVSRFNTLRGEGVGLHDAISGACRDRLRAVLLTSFTTFAGLMPLLGETSSQAQFLIPAAVSLAYGIMFATLITLILIPSLLMIQADVAKVLVAVKHWYFPEKGQRQIC